MQGIYLEEWGINFVKVCLGNYWGTIGFLGVFIAGIIWLWFQERKEQKMFFVYTIFLFVTAFNPILVKNFWVVLNQDATYYRLFWLLPVGILLGYLAVCCMNRTRKKAHKLMMIIVILGTVMFVGEPMKNVNSLLAVPDNLYKVPDDVLWVSEYIHQDCQGDTPYVACDTALLMLLRQYDASIRMSLDNSAVLCWQGMPLAQDWLNSSAYWQQKPIMDVIYAGDISRPQDFIASVEATQTQYLAFSNNIDIHEFLVQQQFTLLGKTDNYVIYKYAPRSLVEEISMELQTEEVELVIPGLENEYKFVFLSDLHIIVENDEIKDDQLETVQGRQGAFSMSNGITAATLWKELPEILQQGNDFDAVLLGGDMIDYASTTNINALKQGIDQFQTPVMYVRADHDYDYYTYCDLNWEYTKHLHEEIDGNGQVSLIEYSDLCILGIDNSTSQITEDALKRIKEIYEIGKPIILLTHVPLDSMLDESLGAQSAAVWEDRELLWGEECIYKPNEYTKEFLDMVYAEDSLVKAVLSGHLHFSWDGKLTDNTTQHVFAPSCIGNVGIVNVNGEISTP